MSNMSKNYVDVDCSYDKTIVLRLKYSRESMSTLGFSTELQAQVFNCYEKRRMQIEGENFSCVIVFDSDYAMSPINRMLLNLWEKVEKNGQVVCVRYPSDYMDALVALGLLGLPGFCVAEDMTTAINMVKAKT